VVIALAGTLRDKCRDAGIDAVAAAPAPGRG
jgi:hypothetical protein